MDKQDLLDSIRECEKGDADTLCKAKAENATLRARVAELEGRLRYVRDWIKHAANSDGGLVSDIDVMLDAARASAGERGE